MIPGVVVHEDGAAAGRAVARRLGELAAGAVGARRRFSVAVSGGKSPEPMFAALAEATADWGSWSIYWCDERLVPATDPRSNAGLAERLWLAPAKVPPASVHRVPTGLGAEPAADRYEAEVRNGCPGGLDAVVLGVGPDGHTASLFPGSPTLQEQARWVVAEPHPALEPRLPRVTLTLPALARAHRAFFLAWGADKTPTLRRIFSDPRRGSDAADLPAARVAAGTVEWHVDRSAWPTD